MTGTPCPAFDVDQPTRPLAPSRASLVWLGGAAALALALWAVTVSTAVAYAGSELELLVYIAGLMAAVVTGCAVALGSRYFLHDSIAKSQAQIIDEVNAIKVAMARRLDDSTAEFSAEMLQLISQQAMSAAQLAALSEQISVKIDRVYWNGYGAGAHDVGAGAEIIQLPRRGGA